MRRGQGVEKEGKEEKILCYLKMERKLLSVGGTRKERKRGKKSEEKQ